MSTAPSVEVAVIASRREVAVAVRCRDQFVVPVAGNGASPSDVASLVATAVAECGATPSSIRRIVLDRGPGSYTGLRSALAFARTLAAFHPIELGTITSMEWIALEGWRAHGERRQSGTILVALDARRGHHHLATLHCSPDAVSLRSAPTAVAAAATENAIAGCELVIAESNLHATLAASCAKAGARLVELPPVDARSLFDPSLAVSFDGDLALEPLYLLPSYAEAIAPAAD
ncbi:MAG: tRNA (adenosine(37)-N6)-threonylcarbamoyltransferase complex dimerization subunit type 1 TsaB [Planctomycetota bacterium]